MKIALIVALLFTTITGFSLGQLEVTTGIKFKAAYRGNHQGFISLKNDVLSAVETERRGLVGELETYIVEYDAKV